MNINDFGLVLDCTTFSHLQKFLKSRKIGLVNFTGQQSHWLVHYRDKYEIEKKIKKTCLFPVYVHAVVSTLLKV